MAETQVPKEARLDFARKLTGREIQTVRELTEAEAHALIRQLVADKEALATPGEPQPEYHGEESEPEDHEGPAMHSQPEPEREVPTTTAPKGAAAPLTAAQGRTIGRMLEELEIGSDMGARYISGVLGREVARVSELSRGDASKVLKQLVADKESLANVAQAAEEDLIEF